MDYIGMRRGMIDTKGTHLILIMLILIYIVNTITFIYVNFNI
jgi:hypothetical protein